LLTPHEESAFRTFRREWIERRLVRAFVKQFRQRLFFRPSHRDRVAIHDLCDVRIRIIHIADKDRLRRANDHARGLELHVNAMRAEVTFFSGVVVRIDEDRVVRARGHARFAANADRFVEIDDTVGALEHRRRRTGSYARRVHALIAARYLVCAACLWKHADVNVFDVSTRDRDWDEILRLARSRARMTADTACVVDYLRPLNRGRRFHHRSTCWEARLYHTALGAVDPCGVTH